jgi:hypothetical protein
MIGMASWEELSNKPRIDPIVDVSERDVPKVQMMFA